MIETKDSESDTTGTKNSHNCIVAITMQDMPGQDATQSGIECTTQVFFQKLPGLNNWKFVYAIALEKHWEVIIIIMYKTYKPFHHSVAGSGIIFPK